MTTTTTKYDNDSGNDNDNENDKKKKKIPKNNQKALKTKETTTASMTASPSALWPDFLPRPDVRFVLAKTFYSRDGVSTIARSRAECARAKPAPRQIRKHKVH